jgi:hypothetical protein
MKITNRMNLPLAIVEAVKNDGYSKGNATISVTTLIDSPRVAILEEKYNDQLEEDASSRIWSLFGQAIHTILERANKTAIAERRLSIDVEGWTISGGMDVYEEHGNLSDYKVTNVAGIDRHVKKAELQLNIYAAILRHNGHKVEKLEAVIMLRDWYKAQATSPNNINYPQAAVVNVDIPLWSPETAMKYLRERVILHQQARVTLPECSKEDRWAKEDMWAVMKVGGKKAVKLYLVEADADAHAASEKNHYVVFRPANSPRCQMYCSVAEFCSQYQEEKRASKASKPVLEEVS